MMMLVSVSVPEIWCWTRILPLVIGNIVQSLHQTRFSSGITTSSKGMIMFFHLVLLLPFVDVALTIAQRPPGYQSLDYTNSAWSSYASEYTSRYPQYTSAYSDYTSFLATCQPATSCMSSGLSLLHFNL